ncbi:hypothetical protein P22_2773 [Propionispora sp. 2/2-37]|nr:hypothetical protein [Propionispora sp. 2/2-37]CUH96683.1 hypothetical protein P22_2773 [Propionispora sp. 2/2-37]
MSIFPEPILKLPEADIPLQGIRAYLSQGDNHQIKKHLLLKEETPA